MPGPGGHRGGPGGGFGRGPMPPHHHPGMGPRPPRRGFGCGGCLMPVLGVIGLIVLVLAILF